eukprot:CAMPEP_0174252072 /NCGR_PEP_ID=MMETSP0439-20130205/1698_1 /TAXON_ID=0 /ORGANISM="Stereomyxa ramosa, Strain Chinc5" /LENGTH=491 /DNA_ID=CAMNT_0015332559 /DNA_START=50 /DNA_END=1525 /DNA_ORIENTATION=+
MDESSSSEGEVNDVLDEQLPNPRMSQKDIRKKLGNLQTGSMINRKPISKSNQLIQQQNAVKKGKKAPPETLCKLLEDAQKSAQTGRQLVELGDFEKAENYFLESESFYLEVVKTIKQDPSLDYMLPKEELSDLYVLWSDTLQNQGKSRYQGLWSKDMAESEIAELDRIFVSAKEKVEKSFEFMDNNPHAYHSLGSALSCRADLKIGSEANVVYKEAIEQFKRAIDCCEDDEEHVDSIWRSWGNVLLKRAKLSSKPEKKAQLTAEAGKKYENAIKIHAHDPINTHCYSLFLCFQANSIFKAAREAALNGKTEEQLNLLKQTKKNLQESLRYKYNCLEALDLWSVFIAHYAEVVLDKQKSSKYLTWSKEARKTSVWLQGIMEYPFEEGEVLVRCGYLTKQGAKRTNWLRRFFILTNYKLTYHVSPGAKPKGVIRTKDMEGFDTATINLSGKDRRFGFHVKVKKRTFQIVADSADIREQWVDAFRSILPRLFTN